MKRNHRYTLLNHKGGLATIATIFSSLLLFISCTSGPVAIQYGEEECARCKMIITDKRFGAELITTKGKVYKFDAIECLIPTVIENGESKYREVLVTDYNNPAHFIPAQEATFLINEEVPSPMGGFLSAYPQKTDGLVSREKHGGKTFDWDSIVDEFED